MNAIKKGRASLRLKAHNCENFEVTIVVAEKDFRQDMFLKALPKEEIAEAFKERRPLAVVCGRQTKNIDYRVHVGIHSVREGSPKLSKLHFHLLLEPTDLPKPREELPPYAEEIFEWLSQFIPAEVEIELRERASFVFPTTTYRSVFSLPSVLSGALNSTENEIFEGAQVVGVSANLQNNKAGVKFANQRVSKNLFSSD